MRTHNCPLKITCLHKLQLTELVTGNNIFYAQTALAISPIYPYYLVNKLETITFTIIM